MAILKKSDILKGINAVQRITIDSLGGEMWLRPLSSAELDEINYIEAEGMGNFEQNNRAKSRNLENSKLTQTNKFNVLKLTKATDKAKYEMIYKSLDNPKNEDDPWTLEEIKSLGPQAIDELHKEVQKLSGLEITESDVKQFPEDKWR